MASELPGARPGARFTVLVLLVSAVVGCGTRTTSIEKLLDDPARYDGKNVRVAGQVTENVSVLGYGAYLVDDGTGAVTVVTQKGGVPRQGARVSVVGRFRSGFTLGSTTLAVIVEERRRTS